MESKRKNVYIVIFVITTIIAACIAIYFGVNYKSIETEYKQENEKLGGEIEVLNKKIEQLNSIESSSSSNNVVESKENTQETVKEVSVVKALEYDYTKSKNVDNNENYKGAISRKFWDGEKELTLLIYSDGVAKISVVLDGGNIIEYPINNLEGKVKDGMIGRYKQGQDAVYLLLENGTVQTITDFSFKQMGFNANIGVISGVNNIVRLETVVNAGRKILPIAIDKDGYYYAL